MTKKIALSILLLSVFSVKAQSNTAFLDKYNKLNLEFGLGYFYGAKTSPLPSTLAYSFKNYKTPHFGLQYDIFHKEQFNFKIGFSTFLLRDVDEVRFDKSETTADSDWITGLETLSGDWQFNIPITVEYLTYLAKSKLTFNVSYILGYQDYGYAETEYGIGNSNEMAFFKGKYSRGNDVWHSSTKIGVGLYFPFNKWMLRTNLYYNIMLEKMYEGTFEFRGLRESPDINGTYSFSGNSFGVEFSIYLAKKRKKHKTE